MSRIYLVRHGQAGTREVYDSLSDLGRQQARLLGEYFVAEGIRFAAAYSGTLARQERTAAEVNAAYAAAAVPFPEIQPDCGWNEFDLAHVYQSLAPQLCAEDPEFRNEYEAMEAEARAAAGQHGAAVNRRWLPCDVKLVSAWIEGRYSYDGESWRDFQERVGGCRSRLDYAGRDATIVIFTSATPIGVWTGLAMGVGDGRVMRLAGALHNTSYTLMRLRGGDLRLDSFNAIPHLSRELRTYR